MLQKTVNVISFRLEEKHQNLMVRIDEAIPRALFGDDQRLAQVIANLLSNAVKFTPDYGSISLDARLSGKEGDLCTLLVKVSDSGIGISREQQSRLFSSFEQADSGTSRKFGGTGLGLAISKSIVEMMGGGIQIESEVGKGATFIFTVQIREGKQDDARPLLGRGSWDAARILAADSAPEIREYFGDIARRLGANCDTASDWEEAATLIEKNGPYDVYFAGRGARGEDSLELARRIKEKSLGRPVIVMTPATEWNLIEDEARSLGIGKFLPKPLFPSAVAGCLAECLGMDAPPASENGRPGDGGINRFEGRRIILAEDVEINREIVLALLEPTALAIECAENGEEALALYSADPGRYNMIFMDLQMPKMDGYEATRRIRAFEEKREKKIPIIAMTANVFREDIEKCLQAGMNDHIGKPLNLDDVLERLRAYLPQTP
jgi:CheY-like chemotaxis protein